MGFAGAVMGGACRAPTLNRLFPNPTEQGQEVAVENTVDVRLRIAAARQDGPQLLNVGDGPQVGRHLLGAEPAVGIGADAHMTNVPGQLTDVVNVIDREILTRIESFEKRR